MASAYIASLGFGIALVGELSNYGQSARQIPNILKS